MIGFTNKKHWLQELVEVFPSKTFLHDNDAQIKFFDFYNSALRLASQLTELGITKNDKVGILSENKKEFVELIFALWFIGAIPVPLNIRNSYPEIEASINRITINSILIQKDLARQYDQIKNIPNIYFPIEIDNKLQITEPISFSLDDNALILFTSGSTKKPKAVVHTFKSLFEGTKLTSQFSNLSENDRWLASLPFYHIGGFMIIVRSLINGSQMFLPNGLKSQNIIDAMNFFNPTHISLVETVLKDILESNVKLNSELKQLYLGGGPLSTQLCESGIVKGFPICKVYGSTETCSMISGLQADKNSLKMNSVGLPLGETEIKIVDASRTILNTNQIGEIAIKSKSNFKEYYDDDELTESVLQNGFYFSGDYGFLDSDGYLYIVNRREDIIITGGENVNIKEVEDVILNIPEIDDVFIFGEDDETWGQIVCAAIEVNKPIDRDTIINLLKKTLAAYKIPKKFYFVSEIPRSDLGKVIREKLFSNLKLNEP
jgi:O-succinylbenzoic acid--CoA ligase